MEPIVNMLVRCHHIPNNLRTSRTTGTQSHFQYHCGSMMIDWCAALYDNDWQRMPLDELTDFFGGYTVYSLT